MHNSGNAQSTMVPHAFGKVTVRPKTSKCRGSSTAQNKSVVFLQTLPMYRVTRERINALIILHTIRSLTVIVYMYNHVSHKRTTVFSTDQFFIYSVHFIFAITIWMSKTSIYRETLIYYISLYQTSIEHTTKVWIMSIIEYNPLTQNTLCLRLEAFDAYSLSQSSS